jgi:hypothetical protein
MVVGLQRKDAFGDPYGHPPHCYKGRSVLFNHGDLEGETRLEMTGSTSSIRIRIQPKKLKIKLKLLSFYSNKIFMSYIRDLPKSPLSVKVVFCEAFLSSRRKYRGTSMFKTMTSVVLVEPVPTACPTLSGTKYSKRTDFVGRVTIRVAV